MKYKIYVPVDDLPNDGALFHPSKNPLAVGYELQEEDAVYFESGRRMIMDNQIGKVRIIIFANSDKFAIGQQIKVPSYICKEIEVPYDHVVRMISRELRNATDKDANRRLTKAMLWVALMGVGIEADKKYNVG